MRSPCSTAPSPGKATSYGNAGFIAIDHVLPLARPSTLKRVPQMLMDRNGPLTVHRPSIPYLLPWMARFARAAYSHGRGAKGMDSFGPLMAEANIAWKAEIQASGLGELFKSRGCALRLRERGGVRRTAPRSASCRRPRAPSSRSSTATARASWRPASSSHIVRGVYYPHGMHTINPYRVVDDPGRALRRRRRHDRCAAACAASRARATRSPRVQLTDGELPAKAVVIAAGRASGELTRLLGFNAPLVAERGYHVMLAPDNVRFEMPVSPAERGFFVTPMEEGLRVAGTVELAAPHQPPSWHRADLLVKHLKAIFPGVGGAEQQPLDRRAPQPARLPARHRPRAAAGQRLLRLRPPACRPDPRDRDRPPDRPPDGRRGTAGGARRLRSRPFRLKENKSWGDDHA